MYKFERLICPKCGSLDLCYQGWSISYSLKPLTMQGLYGYECRDCDTFISEKTGDEILEDSHDVDDIRPKFLKRSNYHISECMIIITKRIKKRFLFLPYSYDKNFKMEVRHTKQYNRKYGDSCVRYF